MRYTHLLITALTLCCACRKTYDEPAPDLKPESARIEMRLLKQRCHGNNSYYRFGEGDTNLYATVTMDELSGNLYKQVFISGDDGSALMLKLTNSGGLFTGDRIRINLNRCWLVCANNMLYIDSLDIEKSLVKVSSGHKVAAAVTGIDKIVSVTDPFSQASMQSRLVELNGVEFVYSARNKPFANAIGKTALEYDLTDCKGNKITVRTSGMSNFAAKPVPSGNGKLIGVVQQYNNEMSLVIRNYNELSLNSTPCTGPPQDTSGKKYLLKDFNDQDLLSGEWKTAVTTGTTSWTCSNIGQSSYYARIYNKNGSQYEACESWLISPSIDLSTAVNPVLNFMTANSSTASPLSLMVSTTYTGGTISANEWTEVPFAFQKNSFTYFSSGDVSLLSYRQPNLRIAFRYRGTSSTGSIWDVDDILIKEKSSSN